MNVRRSCGWTDWAGGRNGRAKQADDTGRRDGRADCFPYTSVALPKFHGDGDDRLLSAFGYKRAGQTGGWGRIRYKKISVQGDLGARRYLYKMISVQDRIRYKAVSVEDDLGTKQM